MSQLSLLDGNVQVQWTQHRRDAELLRERLPQHVRLGTVGLDASWLGTVFSAARGPHELLKDGLREWATHPLFSVYGWDIDDAEAPIERDALLFAHELPPSHACVVSAPRDFGSPRLADGSLRHNPRFLNARELVQSVVAPVRRVFGPRLFAFVLRFAHTEVIAKESFAERLSAFLRELRMLEGSVAWAVDLPDARLLSLDYARVLAEQGVTHVLRPGLVPPERVPSAPHMVVRLDGHEVTSAFAYLRTAPDVPHAVLIDDPGDGRAPLAAMELSRLLGRRTNDLTL